MQSHSKEFWGLGQIKLGARLNPILLKPDSNFECIDYYILLMNRIATNYF